MRTNIIFLLTIGLLLYSTQPQWIDLVFPVKIPPALIQEEGCAGKKTCAVAYLAPWCPACNAVIPQLQEFLKKSKTNPDIGIQIIVGAGKGSEDNINKAMEIGSGVADNDNRYGSALRINYYPTFFVINNDSILLHKDRAAMNWMNKHLSN